MSAFIFGTIVTVLVIALAIGGMLLVRKKVPAEVLKVDHDVATALIAVLGTLYAIVLGLVVVDALNHREQAEIMEGNEGNALATVMHLVRTLPVDQRRPIMQAELDYCAASIDIEWDMLSTGDAPNETARKAFDVIWQRVAELEPKTNRETNLHNSLLTAMTDFSNARRYRIVTCKHGLPSLLWLILIMGGICTIGFTYFFSAEKFMMQALMTSIVAFMLCLNILLVYFYGCPYKGDLRVLPSSLAHVRFVLLNAPVLQNQPNSANTEATDASKAKNRSPSNQDSR
jgi:hypothetical protein